MEGEVKDEIEVNSDMKLCKYVLTFEAWVLSIVGLPFFILGIVTVWIIKLLSIVCKYINWCCVKSIFRLIWLPLDVVIWMNFVAYRFDGQLKLTQPYQQDPLTMCILLIWFVIASVGTISWLESYAMEPNHETDYIKSKLLWRKK